MKRENTFWITVALTVLLAGANGVFAQVTDQKRISKTVTNADLERYRQKRLQNESEYERLRVTRGFPTRVELEQREAERLELLTEFSEQAREQAADESYFRERAFALREEIAATEAEINYLRNALAQTGGSSVFYGYSYGSALGYGSSFGYGYTRGYRRRGYPNRFGAGNAPITVPQGVAIVDRSVNPTPYAVQPGGVAIVDRTVNPVNPNQGIRNGRGFNRPRGGRSGIGVNVTIGTPGYGYPYNNGSYFNNGFGFGGFPLLSPLAGNQFYQREELLARLRELEQQRAGLLARFSVLEDEARRAGIDPGVLR